MRKVAILIAVEDYADSRIPRVKYAEADAQELAAVLEGHGFTEQDQTVLVNSAATKALVESRVRRVLANLTKDDTLYLYYAGHGFAENAKNYVTCYDTALDDLQNTSPKSSASPWRISPVSVG